MYSTLHESKARPMAKSNSMEKITILLPRTWEGRREGEKICMTTMKLIIYPKTLSGDTGMLLSCPSPHSMHKNLGLRLHSVYTLAFLHTI